MILRFNILNILFCILIFTNIRCNNFPDFDLSMQLDSQLYKNKYSSMKMIKDLEFLKKLYEKNYPKKITKIKEKIPKIIHQIWVGPKKIPECYKIWQKTWIKLHPNWKYILWTDKEVASLSLYNKVLYEKTNDIREKADLLKYEILYKYGGLYVDMDFECLKSFDDFLYYDFFVGIVGNEHQPIFNNGLIGTTSSNNILKEIIENINYQDIDNWFWRSGVFYFSKKCIELLKKFPNNVIAFPISFFYSIPYTYNPSHTTKQYINPETYALHYWGNKIGMNT